MYFKKCWLMNSGPLRDFRIEAPFNSDGTPKPIVIVGGNGAGKTILMSHLVDGLVEIAKTAYRDVVPAEGQYSPYFRVVGSITRTVGTEFGFSILEFELNENPTDEPASQRSFLLEKSGDFPASDFNNDFQEQFKMTFSWPETDHKLLINADEKTISNIFRSGCYAFFPSNRYEHPHWFNRKDFQEEAFWLGSNFRGQLTTRPLIVSDVTKVNRQWILHVILDARVDAGLDINPESQQLFLRVQSNIPNWSAGVKPLQNINTLIRQIFKDDAVRIGLSPRSAGDQRLALIRGDEMYLPSLDHLSTGQAILLNLFLTILRYADRHNPQSSNPSEIQGMVLVDEVDAHLHADLQFDVLPKLIKLFPKIQFILSSHAPLFVLGMEKEFGADGYALVEMPSGQAISAERFSEFLRSFEHYRQTKAFDDSLRDALSQQTKPLVFTEGDTDVDYIRAALELAGRSDLLASVEIQWIGAYNNGQPFSTGISALDHAKSFLQANPAFVENRRVLFLYDCEAKTPPFDCGNLAGRVVQRNEKNTEITIGIENLLPQAFCIEIQSDQRFYSMRRKKQPMGGVSEIPELQKRALCNYVCYERRNPSDFASFSVVISLLDELSKEGQL